MLKITLFLLLFVALVLVSVQPAAACPGCKEALANQEDQEEDGTGSLARAYAYSIYFMLGMPLLIFGGFATACYVAWRKHQAANGNGSAAPPEGRINEVIEAQPQAPGVPVEE